MTEIGSEFWDVPTIDSSNGLFPKFTRWFLSGRSALQAIIRELRDYHTAAIPSWCCDSMIKPFLDAGFEVKFYSIWFDHGFHQKLRFDCDILFVMDYFGYSCKQEEFSSYKGIVIRDVTHSLFSSTYSDADYYFGSLRKWCGVWTGGYAWAKDEHLLYNGIKEDQGYISLRKEAMERKKSFIDGIVADKEYLNIFSSAEDVLEGIGIVVASERDIQIARKIDVNLIRSKRHSNAVVLRKAFPEWVLFSEMNSTDSPMFVPVLVPNGKRNDLRQYLISKKIYCPVHWPISEFHKLDEEELFIYNNELSLVCDQRYAQEDMLRIVDTVKRFMEE